MDGTEVRRDRHVSLQGAHNFRDLGGYRTHDGRTTRWGHLFRSDTLDDLTEQDLSYLQNVLGITRLVDLREPSAARILDGLVLSTTVRYTQMPLDNDNISRIGAGLRTVPGMVNRYEMWLKNPTFGSRVAETINLISSYEAAPMVFYCTMGKDRTGILAAMILGSIGVIEEDIVWDYALSAEYADQTVLKMKQDPENSVFFSLLPRWALESSPETMETVLATVRDEYGCPKEYVRAHGVEDATLERLEAILLA